MGRFGGPAAPGAGAGTGVGAGGSGAGIGAGGRTPPGAEPDRHRPFPPDRSMARDGGRGRSVGPPVQHGDAGTPGAPPVPTPPGPPSVAPNVSFPDPNQMRIDLAPIRRELFREMAPNGSYDQMTPEERQRIGREVNQRLLGIVQGMKLGAAELQKKAEAAQAAAGPIPSIATATAVAPVAGV